MNDHPPPAPLPDPATLLALQERFEAARAACPELAGAEVNEVLRVVPGKRAIMAGTLIPILSSIDS